MESISYQMQKFHLTGGEEPKPAENQTDRDPVTESDKKPPLPVLQEATSSH
jgi:hypothetical protein